jgi:hypothetical protein
LGAGRRQLGTVTRVGALPSFGCRARYGARAMLSTYPAIYLPFARRKYGREAVLSGDTELVIEGFQRSGNTFAVIAFELAQDRPTRTAHHLHAAAHVVAAAERGVPILLLIRDPEATVVSHMLREPCITPRQALSNWIRFYERVLPYRDRMVVGEFGAITSDFGPAVDEINRRFGTTFRRFAHTEDNVARCFVLIDERNRRRYGAIVESHVARPSTHRDELKHALVNGLAAPSLSDLLVRARAVYRSLVPARTGS